MTVMVVLDGVTRFVVVVGALEFGAVVLVQAVSSRRAHKVVRYLGFIGSFVGDRSSAWAGVVILGELWA